MSDLGLGQPESVWSHNLNENITCDYIKSILNLCRNVFLQILTNIDCSENLVANVGVEDVGSGLDDAHDQDLERVQLAKHRSQWDQHRCGSQTAL